MHLVFLFKILLFISKLVHSGLKSLTVLDSGTMIIPNQKLDSRSGLFCVSAYISFPTQIAGPAHLEPWYPWFHVWFHYIIHINEFIFEFIMNSWSWSHIWIQIWICVHKNIVKSYIIIHISEFINGFKLMNSSMDSCHWIHNNEIIYEFMNEFKFMYEFSAMKNIVKSCLNFNNEFT